MQRLFSPHIILILSCAAYIVFGAYVFQRLEGQALLETKAKHLRYIDRDSQIYAQNVQRLVEENLYQLSNINNNYVKDEDYVNDNNDYIKDNNNNYVKKDLVFLTDDLDVSVEKLALIKYIQQLSSEAFDNVRVTFFAKYFYVFLVC